VAPHPVPIKAMAKLRSTAWLERRGRYLAATSRIVEKLCMMIILWSLG
jgi:hypothetical protein